MNPLVQRIKSVIGWVYHYRRSTAMLVIIMSTISFILGFSVSQLIKGSVGTEITSPIISTLASLGGFFGVFREYFKDKREGKKTPELKYDKIPIKKPRDFSTGIKGCLISKDL